MLSITANANDYFQPYNIIKERFGLHKHQDKPRLFLIAVIDTDDETIGKRCEEDLDEVTYTFDELADWLDVQMAEPKIIKGDSFSKAAVNDALDNWLRSQQPTADDIVVFYYSGHGFRYQNDAGSYPRMWLKTASDKNVEANNLRIEEDVYNRIIKMGAGFNLVLADCCNTTAAGDNADFDNVMVPTRKREVHKRDRSNDNSDDDDGLDNAEKLFTPGHPLSILANAADKGEFAAGKADVGGFFTYYFTEALEDCIYDNKIQPSWESIFKYADERAGYWAKSAACPQAKHNEQGRCVQTAKFKMDN